MNETDKATSETSGSGKFPFPGSKKVSLQVAVDAAAAQDAAQDAAQAPEQEAPAQKAPPVAKAAPAPKQVAVDQVQLAKNGEPYVSAEAARAAIIKENMPGGDDTWGVMEYEGGFGITTWRNIASIRERRAKEEMEAKRLSGMRKMTFSRVRLAPKFSDNDPEVHVVMCNGHDLTLRRGCESVIPDSHLEIIKNASMEDIQPLGQNTSGVSDEGISFRVGVGRIARIPIESVVPATAEEFEQFRREQGKLRDDELVKRQMKAG